MQNKFNILRKAGLVGIGGLMAFAVSSAHSADFTVTSEVSTALTVDVIENMNLGNVFATNASTTNVGIVRLSAQGVYSPITTASATIPTLIGLDGATAARGSVSVGNNTAFTVELPPAISSTELEAADTTLAALITDLEDDPKAVELRIGGAGGDPNVARLYLVNFRLGNVTGGTASDGTATNCTSDTRLTAGDPIECILTPSFGSPSVAFSLGADLITDGSGTRTTYQAGTYTGSFTVTATY